jgi:hypothetical protein
VAQPRVLVFSSHALYRLTFHRRRNAVAHYARSSLVAMKIVTMGRAAFRVASAERDGRENP